MLKRVKFSASTTNPLAGIIPLNVIFLPLPVSDMLKLVRFTSKLSSLNNSIHSESGSIAPFARTSLINTAE
jgi:hypothetical protein